MKVGDRVLYFVRTKRCTHKLKLEAEVVRITSLERATIRILTTGEIKKVLAENLNLIK